METAKDLKETARWSYSPMGSLRASLERLEQAKAMGFKCDSCGRVLIENILIKNGRRFHEGCAIKI